MASNVNVAGDDDLRPQELRQSFVSRSEAVDAVQEFSQKQNKALQQNAIKSGGSVILLGCTDRLGKSNGTCPVSVRINKSTTSRTLYFFAPARVPDTDSRVWLVRVLWRQTV